MKFFSDELETAYDCCEEIFRIAKDPAVIARIENIVIMISSADGEMEDMHYEIKNSLLRV